MKNRSFAGVLATMMLIMPAGAQPSVAGSSSATAAGPVAKKCRGRVRQGCRAATAVSTGWQMPAFDPEPEPKPTETLAEDLDAAYRTAPALQAQRYQLRASDEDYAQALSELGRVDKVDSQSV